MNKQKKNDMTAFQKDKEYITNTYVMKCFNVSMCLYFITFILNVLDIFIVDKSIMLLGFVPSLIIYFAVSLIVGRISLSNTKIKYILLFFVVAVYTIIGVIITYHAVY